jgi:predicted dehydrogenase
MIKVGIIGCGKIADAHVEQIQRIAGAKIVGVCDKEELMARQLYERFDIRNYYSDISEFLETARPDVVHITTPPQSHFELGKLCLEAGCHVYIEKPFTVNYKEAIELIDFATEKRKKITVGHDYQFTHAKMRMRELIKNGYLGGPPVHMESYHCYELGTESYARALLGDKKHWVRMLPGTLMHNNISHGICSIAEYLTSDNPRIIAHGYTSPFLRWMKETDIIDEARVIITENQSKSAYFTFSTQMRPVLHQFRVYGKDNMLIVDHDQQTCIKISGIKYKSYLEKFIPPVVFAIQYAENSLRNIRYFLKKDFHMKSGMKYLIESFYRSILEGIPLPITYREILVTSKIMDEIFTQLKSGDPKIGYVQ